MYSRQPGFYRVTMKTEVLKYLRVGGSTPLQVSQWLKNCSKTPSESHKPAICGILAAFSLHQLAINDGPQRILEANMMVGAKGHVDKVTVKCCLIKNRTESSSLDYVHCLKRSTGGHLAMSPNFHKTFNANKWLLPETWIINTYYDGIRTHKFPVFEDEVYEYTLIAYQGMQNISVCRQKSTLPGDPSDLPTPMEPPTEDFTNYHYLGSKLKGHWFWWKKEYEMRKFDLKKVGDIWYLWKRAQAAPGGLAKTTSDSGDLDIKTDSSQKTTFHRMHRSMCLKCKAAREQDSLDYETLHKFDQQTSSHNSMIQKNMLIQEWLAGSRADF
ncbi:hypothetical protein EDB85DRAFT_1891680 [Lactarius pseudohatsudake]|nr:hypothetical protein EDB85DRAFT_1891680 [Lactarius pseudohatsudake]